MADTPICHIPPAPPIPSGSAPRLPNIPVATDLASALAAINAIRQMLMLLAGQIRQQPNRLAPGGRGGGNSSSAKSSQSKSSQSKPNQSKQSKPQGRWNEATRTTDKIKVTNPQDASQFVEVERITGLTMRDSQTGESWIWKR